jgi:competence protein ComEA
LRAALFRVISWIALFLLLLVCSCAKLPRRQVSAGTRDNSPTLLPNATLSATRVNLNTASAIELEALSGIGKVLAERIVAHREQYGAFRRVEHLMMVRGFSDHKFRAIQSSICVE